KTIGYSAGGSLSPEILRQWLKNNGVDPTTVKLINVKMDLVQALLTHRIDAAADVVRSVEVVELEQMGYHPTVFLPEQSGVPTYEEMLLIANTQHLNPKTIQAFVAALTEAEHYLAMNPEKSWKIASQYYKSALAATPEMTKTNHAIWLATVPYFGTDPTAFNAKQYQAFNAFLVQIGTLQQSIPLSRYTIGS
ncbi:MAG: ABC transporter substrate-binding protein, partial [Proteobacteria bacterium]|nr:ABC transporter substrate-binding protein [Pseudomonadota bacterium]